MLLNKKSIWLGTIIALGCYGTSQAQSNKEEIKINFEGWVGEQEFVCGESYENLGTSESTITPTDFRLYISNLALIDKSGNTIPVELEQDNKWQYKNVALIDFENGKDVCDNGTPETRNIVVGNAPKGDYEKLQFTLGVPKNLNHKDAAIAPSPLNLTSMWWNWQGGYKFLRVDLENEDAISSVPNLSPIDHGASTSERTIDNGHGENKPDIFKRETDHHSNHQQSQNSHSHHNQTGHHGTNHQVSHSTMKHADNNGNKGYSIHLGSTGCKDVAQSSLFNCANPNRPQITLEDFNPNENVVIVDLAEFLANSDLNTNAAETPNGCISAPDDGDCKNIMENLGLSTASTEQTLFWVE